MRQTRWSDLIVVSALVLLAFPFAIALAQKLNEADGRKRCAANLKQIGQALLLYSNDNRGNFPRTIYDYENPKPTWGTPYEGDPTLGPGPADPFAPEDKGKPEETRRRPKPNDVTAAFFMLMRTQDIPSRAFICPDTLKKEWDFGGEPHSAIHWTNWRGLRGIREHLSYSYQNPYPSKAAIGAGFKLNNAMSGDFAVAADMNPGVDALLKLTATSPEAEMRDGNSLNHAREGQNVLYGDGHVDFASHPFAGVWRDNIYTYGNSGNNHKTSGGDGIIGSNVGPDDSILLPTAKSIGLLDAAEQINDDAVVTKVTTDEAGQLVKNVAGKYVRDVGQGLQMQLEISGDKIVSTAGPTSVTYNYTVVGRRGEKLQLSLTAPQTKPATLLIVIVDDGILIMGHPAYEGRWRR